MFQSWRIYLRQADAAWRAGQLDAASRLMLEHRLAEFLPGKELANSIAGSLVIRGRQYVEHGDTSAAWRDLDAATRIAGESSASLDLRERLVAAAIAEAERYLAAEDCSAALACLDRLRERRCDTPAARLLEQTAKRAQAAARLMRRGDFLAAEAELSAAARLRGDLASLGNRLAQCRVQLGAARSWTARLNQAVAGGDWLAAIQACDQLLAIAPDNAAAQQSRQHAAGRMAALAAVGVRMAPAPVMTEVVVPPRAGHRRERHGAWKRHVPSRMSNKARAVAANHREALFQASWQP